jgi:hypothetical protein
MGESVDIIFFFNDFSHLGVESRLYFIGYPKNFLLVLNLPEGKFSLFCKAMEK